MIWLVRFAPPAGRARTRTAYFVGALALLGCTPRVRPLGGAVSPFAVGLPRVNLPARRERIVFRWRYEEQDGPSARGDGVARVAPPDSARLDLYLAGGFAGGMAVLIGDELSVPGGALVQRVVPPAPLLWAALGRLDLPASADTVVRVSGDTLRADVGTGRIYRVTLVGGRIVRLEHIEGGRLVEALDRAADVVRYRNEAARRSLTINIVRTEPADAFPAAIWTR